MNAMEGRKKDCAPEENYSQQKTSTNRLMAQAIRVAGASGDMGCPTFRFLNRGASVGDKPSVTVIVGAFHFGNSPMDQSYFP